MIEIHIDEKNRENSKIIIDGEDIIEKYKITGFRFNYDAGELPILELKIFDDDIKITSSEIKTDCGEADE